MSPDGLALIGPLALAALQQSGWQVDAIGGLTLGADPISYAISYASAETATPLRLATSPTVSALEHWVVCVLPMSCP